MLTRAFWQKAVERATKTFGEVLLAVWGVAEASDADPDRITDYTALKTAAAATVASVLLSLVSSLKGEKDDPSLV